jgi:hypothetical protein
MKKHENYLPQRLREAQRLKTNTKQYEGEYPGVYPKSRD